MIALNLDIQIKQCSTANYVEPHTAAADIKYVLVKALSKLNVFGKY